MHWALSFFFFFFNSMYYLGRKLQCCCCSVAQSCPTLCNPMDCSTPDFPVLHHLQELVQIRVKSVMPSNHLILCHPLLLLPSVFPSIRVFSNESALRIRWPKYWSFNFSFSSSNEHSGLTGLIFLLPKGLSKVSSTTSQKLQFFSAQPPLWSTSHIHT